jgi:phage terminase large subunit-like protein
MPAEENITKRLNFCIWTEQVTRLIPMDAWDSQPERTPLEQLTGRVCYAGLDLSSKQDFTALVLVFRDADGGADVFPYFWLPESKIRDYTRLGIPCEMWKQQGYIEEIPGDMIDQRIIAQRIQELGQEFRIAEIPYDAWNAAYIEAELGEVGAPLVTVAQNFQNLSAPTKEMLALIATGKFRHGDNPVLRWMASNVASLEDSNGNLRPHKGKSLGKIDGITSAIMGLGRAMFGNNGQSIYESRGLLSL